MENAGTYKRRLASAVATFFSLFCVGVASVPAQAAPARDMQWHLEAMQAERMWEVSKGEGVTVAVIDTGVDPTLPDLHGQVLRGKDFTDIPGNAHDDYDGHGTGIASLIAGTGNGGSERGTMGLAPEAKILPLRMNSGGIENAENLAEADQEYAASLAPAIRFAADSEAKIVNISQGSAKPSSEVADAIEYALGKGKLIFASVGNSADLANAREYPAAHPGVVGVGAVDRNVNVTDESQRGPQVDLVAPGEEIIHSCPEGTQLCKSHGTSGAAALASASAALIWAEHPDWTANQVTRVLVETAGGPDSGKDRTDLVGYGAVRPRIALLEGPVDPGDPHTNPLPDSPYYEGKESSPPGSSAVPDDSENADDQAAAPTANDKDNGLNAAEWLLYSFIAAAVLAGTVTVPLTLARRKRRN